MMRLGDKVATLLASLGISKRPGCGCAARQRWLNKIDGPTVAYYLALAALVGVAALVVFAVYTGWRR